MSAIKLYIATSLDGYIAREDGALDWLYALPNPNQIDHGYTAFLESIDVILLGRKTYEEILSFGVDWPYANCHTYVVTSDKNYSVSTENTSPLHELSQASIQTLREESQKNIWIVGGGQVITQFLNLEQIDEMIITIIPTILGKGIPLFPNNPKESLFKLRHAESFETGAVNLSYTKA